MAAKVLSALLAALPLLGCGNVEQRQEWAGWLQNVSQQMRSQPAMSASPTPAQFGLLALLLTSMTNSVNVKP